MSGVQGEVIPVCAAQFLNVLVWTLIDENPSYWVFNIPTTRCEIQKYSLCSGFRWESFFNSLPHPGGREETRWEVSTHVNHGLFEQWHSLQLRTASSRLMGVHEKEEEEEEEVSAVQYSVCANIMADRNRSQHGLKPQMAHCTYVCRLQRGTQPSLYALGGH